MCSNREKRPHDSGFESFSDSTSLVQSSVYDSDPSNLSLSPVSSRTEVSAHPSYSTFEKFTNYKDDGYSSSVLCNSSIAGGPLMSPRRVQNRIDFRRNLNVSKRPASKLLTFGEDELSPSSPLRRTSTYYSTAWNAVEKRRRIRGVGALFTQNKDESAKSAAHAQKYVRHFYNGVERLDIITMLESVPVVLEIILEQFDPQTLRTMTTVSPHWRHIINSMSKASVRLQRYNFESLCSKENNVKQCATKRDQPVRGSRAPLNNYNRLNEPEYGKCCTKATGSSLANMVGFLDHQKAAIEEAPPNCPLCGSNTKIRHVFEEAEEGNIDTQLPVYDQEFSNSSTDRINCVLGGLTIKAQQLRLGRCMHAVESSNAVFGQCMGVLCKYKFCLKCRNPYNPVEKGHTTVFRTPSKIKFTADDGRGGRPIRRKTQRKSLRRLCF